MSISVLKNEGFCQLWGALAQKIQKKILKERQVPLELTLLNPFSEKKSLKKSYFWPKSVLENHQNRLLPP